MQPTISCLDCVLQWQVNFIRQPVMTISMTGPRSSKALPKAKLAPKKKRSWSLFGDLLPIWSVRAFWIPTKPLHLKGVLSKSMRTENCSTCSWPWSTERARLHPHLTAHWPTTPPSHIWTTFCRGKCFHSQQEAENAFQEFIESEASIFMLQK